MTSFELGRFYASAQWAECRSYYDDPVFDYAHWAEYLGCRFWEYPLPTEVVVCSTRIVTPKQGRAYGLSNLYLHEGRVYKQQELPMGVASYDCDRVVLVEVYEDHGDDGHVAWLHMGYRFVGSSELEKRTKVWFRGEHEGPPIAMTTEYEWEKEKDEKGDV